jgi:1-aminocyclopropane-1-carboxylate deaminase/D-cysteine desulfhydrase-like pyridoxal-dependent ACC family enzyme
MAALIRHVRSGDLEFDDTVVFLHTGGFPALFTRDATSKLMDGRATEIR